jgi:spore coat protein A, manganese oxidase
MISRRFFLKLSAIAGVGLVLPFEWLSNAPRVRAFSQSDQLTKFSQKLRMIGSDIPLATKDTANPGWWQPGVDHYTIDIGQFTDKLHPDLPNETHLWGYGQGFNEADPHWTKHLGGVIAAKRGKPVQITFRNYLPADHHILPVDLSIMGADGAVNRADVHLHGGLVPWTSDGGPHAWWDPNGGHGIDFLNNQVLRPNNPAAPNEAEYYYPNDQGSRLLWYHDHTFGATRINAYAGIATGYVIYDDYELSLTKAPVNLPFAVDPCTVYLVFQDKIFVSADTQTKDPTWFDIMDETQLGDLWYAHEYDPLRWDVDLTKPHSPPAISVIPEFFGDTMLVNGTVYPYLEVKPCQYRLRMLNACNARFLNPHLVLALGPENTEPALDENQELIPGPEFIQIGTEGGFLPGPVVVNGPMQPQKQLQLLMAPAERADLIVDFRGKAGMTYILYNDAAAPFPMGDGLNDYYPGNPDTPSSKPGFGPDTRTLLQIKVIGSDPGNPPITIPAVLTPTDPFMVKQYPGYPTPVPEGVNVRRLTLNETSDEYGRLIQFLGTDVALDFAQYGFGRPYDAEPTEVIYEGTTEVWEIANLTGDVHPIHFHLVNVQILSRQLFDDVNYNGGVPTYLDDAYPPEQNELGWKETVRMNPGEVTRVMMKFDLPATPFAVPESPRTGGYEYVWHCHILEHEEHDMMRPLVVKYHKSFIPIVNK